MTNLKFADTHNMVVFLSKPAESDELEQIVDFLNAQPIRYALTVNPTIYISLVLNNFGLLAWSKLSMGNPKTTAWNEFSSTMASAIICLTTNQKFNFSKFIFESMELRDNLVRAATTASSLEAEQDSSNITKTRSKATPIESSSLGTTSGGGPRVLDLEKTKTTQANEIASLKRMVKKLEKKRSSRTHKLKRLYKVGLTARVESSSDEEDLDDADYEMFDVDSLNGDEVFVAVQNENIVKKVLDDAQVNLQQQQQFLHNNHRTKGKGIMIEEPVKPMEKKDQISFGEEDDIQAKIDADYQLAEGLQAQEQEELSVEEKAKLFQQLLEQRRKHFAAKSSEEKRNKPPTQAQQRKIMYTYLKNMEGKKLKDLKNKSFDSIQKMFDRAFKRVNTFVDFRTDLVEGSSKREGEELEQKSTKK
ncbi:hypothetical protein Tco_0779812 [Tanacetum coccineum]